MLIYLGRTEQTKRSVSLKNTVSFGSILIIGSADSVPPMLIKQYKFFDVYRFSYYQHQQPNEIENKAAMKTFETED